MKKRYMLTQTGYSGDEETHITNVSWAMADALCTLLVMQGAHECEFSIDEMDDVEDPAVRNPND